MPHRGVSLLDESAAAGLSPLAGILDALQHAYMMQTGAHLPVRTFNDPRGNLSGRVQRKVSEGSIRG